jgi:putative oxidoreductase
MREGYIKKMLIPAEEYLYTIFRVMVGWLFFMHGAGKVLGWFTAKAAQSAGSLMWFVGLAEITAGLLILLGLFTRVGAILGIIVMIGAWFRAHVPNGWNPLANGGELALMFLITFIFLLIYGSGRYGLEKWFKDKELF